MFGFAVVLDGDTLAVGTPNEDSSATGVGGNQADNSASGAGAVYVFTRSGITWSQQAYLKASNTGASDQFGISVALDGDTLAVGASLEASSVTGVDGNQADNAASGAGAVYVFTRSGVTWSQQAYLKASNTGASDNFGRSVTLDGDTLVVGAPFEDSSAIGVNGNQADNSASNAGAAYVFTRSGVTWSQQTYLKASITGASDQFGWSVALDGDTLLITAPLEDSSAIGIGGNQADNSASNAGAVYVFTRSGVTWSQQAYLKASNTEAADRFGEAATLSGDTLVVGARFEDSNTTGVDGNQTDNSALNAGAAYVFTRPSGGVTWSQQAYLKASNTGTADFFGYSIALSGDTLLVGAPSEASSATGVNGNQADNSANAAGAAYVFTRPAGGSTWSQQIYLKASNTEAQDAFGETVALDGDTPVVAAPREDSNATGVGGNQADNSATGAGAVYFFANLSTTYLPLLFKDYPIPTSQVINPTAITSRLAAFPGEVFFTTTLTIGSPLPDGGHFYLSASPTTPSPAQVDDRVTLRLATSGAAVFSYTYGSPTGVTPALVEVPRAVMNQFAGHAVTIEFSDVFGGQVNATPMYLLWVP